MGVALHAAAMHDAFEGVEGGEQGRRAVPLVIVRHGPALAGLYRQAGLGRSSAWICDFSSMDSTTA
jgi:hypothetical protein